MYFSPDLSPAYNVENLEKGIVEGCTKLLTTIRYERDEFGRMNNNLEVNEWLKKRKDEVTPILALCHDVCISPKMFSNFINKHDASSDFSSSMGKIETSITWFQQ